MANEGEQRELFLTETEKSSALCLANFGDMQGTQTDARNVKELIWNIELRTRKTSGQVTVSYREIGESMFFRAGLGEKATKRAARLAEALGVIRIDCDPRKTGGQGANTFSVNWQAIIRHGHHTTATTRPQEPPQRPQAARRPQEARSPQEATSRPSNHSPQAAPSTSVAESTPVQRPPGHRGGAPGHRVPPYIRKKNHLTTILRTMVMVTMGIRDLERMGRVGRARSRRNNLRPFGRFTNCTASPLQLAGPIRPSWG